MENESCVRVVQTDHEKKKCVHGKEAGCEGCHIADPKVLEDIKAINNDPTDYVPIPMESNPFKD